MSEHDDSRRIVGTLRQHGCMVQPIETKVRNGIPDLYIACRDGKKWVELKHVRANFDASKLIKVPFRPGQQEWALEHLQATGDTVSLLILFQDIGLFGMELTHLYPDKCVPMSKLYRIDGSEIGLATGIIKYLFN